MKRQELETMVEEFVLEPVSDDANEVVAAFCNHYEAKFNEIRDLLKGVDLNSNSNLSTALSIAEDCSNDLY